MEPTAVTLSISPVWLVGGALIGALGGPLVVLSLAWRIGRPHAVRFVVSVFETDAALLKEKIEALFPREIEAREHAILLATAAKSETTAMRDAVRSLEEQLRRHEPALARLPDALDRLTEATTECTRTLAETRERVAHLEGAQLSADDIAQAVAASLAPHLRHRAV